MEAAKPQEASSTRRRSFLLVAGWLLALPGLWVIASFVLQGFVSQWAGCPSPTGMNFPPCPPGSAGALADAMRQTVLITLLASFVGIGMLPPLYSAVFVAWRLANAIEVWRLKRQGKWPASVSTGRVVAVGFFLFMALAMAAGMIARILSDARSSKAALGEFGEGMLGLAAMAALAYGVYRLVIKLRRR